VTIVTQNERRKLVRARIKAKEFLPEWATCCEGSLAELQSLGEIQVDLSTMQEFGPMFYCLHCDRRPWHGKVKAVRIVGKEKRSFAAFELLDLDEGIEP
jgi:hypothetical protein